MPSYIPPKKNTQFVFSFGLVSQANTKILQTNPTLAAGDFKVSTDGGGLGNPATLPTVTPAGGRMVIATLSAGEMNGDMVTFVAADAAGAEWCDLILNIHTSARQIDDLLFPTVSGRSLDVTATGEGGVDWANVGSPTTLVGLTNTSIGTASTMTTGIAVVSIGNAAISTASFAAGTTMFGVITVTQGMTMVNAAANAISTASFAANTTVYGVTTVTTGMAVVAVQSGAISTASFAAGTVLYGATTVTQGMTVVNVAADAIASRSAATAFYNRIIDIAARRQYTNIRSSSEGETAVRWSLLGAIARLVNRTDFQTQPATIYHEDGSTSFFTETMTTATTADAVVQLT